MAQLKAIIHPLDGDIRKLQKWASAAPEKPDIPHLISYGAVSFLAVRDYFARRLTNHQLRQWFEPAIMSGQFLFMDEGQSPRALVTWAHLDDTAQEAFCATGTPPPLEAWFAGRHLWIMSVLCPYRGTKRQCLSWILANVAADRFSACRVSKDGRRSVCHYERTPHGFSKRKQYLPSATK